MASAAAAAVHGATGGGDDVDVEEAMPGLDGGYLPYVCSTDEIKAVTGQLDARGVSYREVMRELWKDSRHRSLRTEYQQQFNYPHFGWAMQRGREITLVHISLTRHLQPGDLAVFLRECYPRMADAHDSFLKADGSLHSVHEEPMFRLYEHMREHEALYFRFLASSEVHAWTERFVGILGTWATILRQRGNAYPLCAEVLELDSRVLARCVACARSHVFFCFRHCNFYDVRACVRVCVRVCARVRACVCTSPLRCGACVLARCVRTCVHVHAPAPVQALPAG